MPLNDTEKAYIAGILDGEGYFGFGKANRGVARIRIRVTNTKLVLIDWLQERLGGSRWILHAGGKFGNSAQSYCIEWAALKAENLINEVLPYLVIKKKQALTLLKWQSTKGTNKKLSSKVITQRKELIQRIHQLNRVGLYGKNYSYQ